MVQLLLCREIVPTSTVLQSFPFLSFPFLSVQDMQDMYGEATGKGAKFLEAPVSGSKVRNSMSNFSQLPHHTAPATIAIIAVYTVLRTTCHPQQHISSTATHVTHSNTRHPQQHTSPTATNITHSIMYRSRGVEEGREEKSRAEGGGSKGGASWGVGSVIGTPPGIAVVAVSF